MVGKMAHDSKELDCCLDDIDNDKKTTSTEQESTPDDSEETMSSPIPKRKQREGYRWYCIDLNTLFMKLAFFCEGAKRGSNIPFLVVFFIDLGLSKSQAGFVTGTRLVGGLIGGFSWGMLADKTKMSKLIITLQNAGSILFMCLHIFIDIYLTPPSKESLKPSDTNYSSPVNHFLLNKSLTTMLNTSSTVTVNTEQTTGQQDSRILYFVLLINILMSFCDGNLMIFLNTAVVRTLDVLPYKCKYDNQAMFLSVGFVFGFLASNVLSSWVFSNVTYVSRYIGVIITYSTLATFGQIFTFILYTKVEVSERKVAEENPHKGSSLSRDKSNLLKLLLKTLKEPSVSFFTATIFVVGVQSSFHFNFMVLYLQDMGAPKLIPTLIFAFTALSGISGFFFGSRIIHLCKGTWNALILVLVMYFLRYLAYGLISNPWVIVAAQLLNGFTLAIVIKVFFIKEVSPTEILTTMFGLGNTVYFSISVIVGNIVGGYVYEGYGGRVMYCAAAILSLAWALLVVVYALIRKGNRSMDLKTKEEQQNELISKSI